MSKDDENSIWFEVLQRLTKIETNTEGLYLQVQHHILQQIHYLNILYMEKRKNIKWNIN